MAAFRYGERELSRLKSRDEHPARAIEQACPVGREAGRDLFSPDMHHIIGPQISTKSQAAIWGRMRMPYHRRRITPALFAKYRRRYSPYDSTARLYLWAVAGGAVPGMRDLAPKAKA